MPIIESAMGCFDAPYIASASPSVVALTIGLEDYTADIGAQRTLEGKESFWARSVVVNAARAAGVTPIDTVFSDVGDMEGLRAVRAWRRRAWASRARAASTRARCPWSTRPSLPARTRSEKARRIVLAFEAAEKQGARRREPRARR